MPPSFLFPTAVPKYCQVEQELEELLRSRLHDPSSQIVQDALHQVALSLPFHPTPQIKYGHPWNRPFAHVRVDMHLNATFRDALDNIAMPISDREKMFLHYLIQHIWGWSATPKQHRSASGFRYLSKVYPEVTGLRPVLDNVVWPEDAQYFPPSLGIDNSYVLVLFASESGYYFMDDWGLYQAGNTLEEVFEGIKEYKYLNNEWDGPDPCTDWFDPEEFFPQYKWDIGDPHWILAGEIPEPPESLDLRFEYSHTSTTHLCDD